LPVWNLETVWKRQAGTELFGCVFSIQEENTFESVLFWVGKQREEWVSMKLTWSFRWKRWRGKPSRWECWNSFWLRFAFPRFSPQEQI
jgi:hypothetical protein